MTDEAIAAKLADHLSKVKPLPIKNKVLRPDCMIDGLYHPPTVYQVDGWIDFVDLVRFVRAEINCPQPQSPA